MSIVNLLEETLKVLKTHDKSPKDVLWVGNEFHKTTWVGFESVANITYDNGYGGNEIASDLLIVGDCWWLERGEYDGSEWWDFKTLPKCESNEFKKLVSVRESWDSELEFE